MNSAWDRLAAFYRRLPPSTTPVLMIIVAVLLGNIIFVTGLATNNPISWTSSISHYVCRVTCGRPMIDPNVGYITQAIGHRAAVDLLHGHMPWWNYFEGLGQPLVGEMQSAALFPLTLLFALPSGLLWFHVTLEVLAGVSTYFLAKRLSIPIVFAVGAGCAFALNGTFAWIGNAVLNPVAFLPMLVLGIEMIYDSARSSSRKGWYVCAIALALSIYAGFPEVAYIDGLFCAGWAIVRFFSVPREFRLVAARRLGLAGVVGGLLSLPVLIPFYDFMKVADVGSHTGGQQGLQHMSIQSAPMLFDPYVYGTIFSNKNVGGFWGGIGGYFDASLLALALLGLFGPRLRPLRMFLGGWFLAAMLGIFNFLNFRAVWDLIPMLQNAAFQRYVMSTCSLSLVLLAVLGIMDFATSKRAQRLFNVTALLSLVVIVWSALEARQLNRGVHLSPKARIIFIGIDAIPFLALLALLVIGRFSKTKVAPLLVTLVLVGESLLLFFVPTAEAAKQVTVDQAPITYLLKHQGQGRYLDFAVLFPNWGSQYGLYSLGAVDLPFPKSYAKFILTKLRPGLLTPPNQFTVRGGYAGIIALQTDVMNHFSAFEGTSLKYLLMPSPLGSNPVPLIPGLKKLGVKLVMQDSVAAIYKMPNPRPFYSTSSKSCTVTSSNLSFASVNCSSSGATLTRTELSMAGWTAYVNGKVVPISTSDGVYQSIAVPQGSSSVTFRFMPPHERYAMLAGLLAGLFLIGSWVWERRTARQPRRRH